MEKNLEFKKTVVWTKIITVQSKFQIEKTRKEDHFKKKEGKKKGGAKKPSQLGNVGSIRHPDNSKVICSFFGRARESRCTRIGKKARFSTNTEHQGVETQRQGRRLTLNLGCIAMACTLVGIIVRCIARRPAKTVISDNNARPWSQRKSRRTQEGPYHVHREPNKKMYYKGWGCSCCLWIPNKAVVSLEIQHHPIRLQLEFNVEMR